MRHVFDKESIGRFLPNLFLFVIAIWIALNGGNILYIVLCLLILFVNIYIEWRKRKLLSRKSRQQDNRDKADQ
jgi:cell division protein FtsL